MLAVNFKRTKIITTIGPASREPKVLQQVIEAGANGLRLNFSHGTQEEHGQVIELARAITVKMGRPVSIIADIQGPKIRLGSLPTDGLPFVREQVVRFRHKADYEAEGIVPIQHDISQYVRAGQTMFLRDGTVEVKIDRVRGVEITATVVTPGILLSNQGINLPDTDLGGNILTPKDIADIEFAAKNDADYVALSFVQRPDDVINLRRRLERLGSSMKIIVKFETRAAVENLEGIVAASDGIMVARGDLAVEAGAEMVPVIQDRLIQICRKRQKFVIVATQMLESMTHQPSPTRAEVSDVATAVRQTADAVMTSGETAMGLFPVQVVKMMQKIINYTESQTLSWQRDYDFGDPGKANAISAAAMMLARQTGAKVIVAETSTGQTARNLASFRPPVPIIMVTDQPRVYQQLAVIWGGKAFLLTTPKRATEQVINLLRQAGNVQAGDLVVAASGHQPGVAGGTDTVRLVVVQ